MKEIFSLVGKVAVEGVDKAKRDIQGVSQEAGNTGSKMGGVFSKMGGLASKAGIAIASGLAAGGTALVALGKQSIEAYAEYEQLTGGIETLFGTGGKSIQEYAQSVGKSVADVQSEYGKLEQAQTQAMTNAHNAWKNQGLSANEYMSQVTSFSASLISSLNGDTVKAVEVADLAMTDMSDNANKMGTDMELIQNAYQGFSKQNFMMLDNLKLGYGGTKEEMQRLLDDAEKIKAANGEMVDYSIDNFADMVEAIHVVQENMGITGTTAKEAEHTISGSANAMKAAWSNMMVAIGDENADFETAVSDLVTSVGNFAENIVPRIKVIFEALPKAIKELMPVFVQLVVDLLPSLIEGAVMLVQGLVEALPTLIGALVTAIWNALPMLLTALGEILLSLGTFILDGLNQLFGGAFSDIVEFLSPIMQGIFDVVSNVWNAIVTVVSTVLNTIWTMITTVWNGIKTTISTVMDGIRNIISNVWNAIKSVVSTVVNGIKTVVSNVWNAISSVTSSVFNVIKTVAYNVWNGVKTTISDVVNGIKTVVSNVWNGIKNTTSNVFNGIKAVATNVWNGIKTAIETPINKAKEIVRNAIEAIKGFFNFEFKWPHIPLPHFSISGSANPLDWLKGGLPKIGIDWYAKGGILERPTAFGISPNGNVRVGGEAGKEAVAPITELMHYVRAAVAEQTGGMNDTLMKILRLLSQILPNLNMQVVLDTGVLVGEIAEPMDDELGKIKERKDR